MKAVKVVAAVIQENDVGAAFGLVPGETKIEVLWELQGEAVWWEGLVVEKTGRKHKLDDHVTSEEISVPIYVIRYVPREPEYPDPTECEVIFTDDHRMMDVTYDGALFWKIKGDAWVPRDDEWASGDPPKPEAQAEENLSAEERGRRAAAEILDPVINGPTMTRMMRAADAMTQRVIAEKFNGVKDALAQHLKEKFEAHPEFVLDDAVANELIQRFMQSKK